MSKQQSQRVFHRFGDLPQELRFQIWEATWEPRTVPLIPKQQLNQSPWDPTWKRNRLPVSAYVNSESRSETLRQYFPCFPQPTKTDVRWFNPRLDTICLAKWYSMQDFKFCNRGHLKKIERMIVPQLMPGFINASVPRADTWPEPLTESFESSPVAELLKDWPKLKEIMLTTSAWEPLGRHLPPSGIERLSHYEYVQKQSPNGSWGHMRTVYLDKLKIQFSPAAPRTYEQQYCRGLSELDARELEDSVCMILKLFCTYVSGGILMRTMEETRRAVDAFRTEYYNDK
ncbi:hypothetical protein F4777DRAFT_597704 [Nemania sp. FL0916]|nr:hypothetical protein F4777DRAFT_597704 [Nemania sp. FL0916]